MIIRDLGLQEYETTWQAMRQFTQSRTQDTPDELWLLEHYPVYTQGQAGKPEHILNPQNIPIVQSDRGGQVTYHGPGQLVGYVLIDLQRQNIGIRTLVHKLEETLIQTLAHYNVNAERLCGAPGVYVKGDKIASIGLRVKHGRTYHGIALNVNMDLTPFKGINPCGYQNMKMAQLRDYVREPAMDEVKSIFSQCFHTELQTTDSSCSSLANTSSL